MFTVVLKLPFYFSDDALGADLNDEWYLGPTAKFAFLDSKKSRFHISLSKMLLRPPFSHVFVRTLAYSALMCSSSSAAAFLVGEPICGVLEACGKKEKLKGGKRKELSTMMVGWEFTTFQEWKTASPDTFISCSELGPLAAYELPMLLGFGFPQRALLPNIVWGYVCAPHASPFSQLCSRDPNVRIGASAQESSAQKGKGGVREKSEVVEPFCFISLKRGANSPPELTEPKPLASEFW